MYDADDFETLGFAATRVLENLRKEGPAFSPVAEKLGNRDALPLAFGSDSVKYPAGNSNIVAFPKEAATGNRQRPKSGRLGLSARATGRSRANLGVQRSRRINS